MYIKNFTDIGKDDVMTVGGKGANLGELTRAGLPVPGGFVVTAQAYQYFTEQSGLKGKIEALLEGTQTEAQLFSAAAAIREAILTTAFPEDLAEEIKEAYRSLNKESQARVAVRSSATAEDLPEASFAGQQETYLNVIGEDELIAGVRRCYASLWGDRAASYRKNQGYDQLSVSLAAVVQQMVESKKAGVLFTANPVTGDRDEMTINASYGLGEAVVSGQVTPDSYVCTKDGKVKSVSLGSKEIQIVYDNKAGGTAKTAVPEDMQKARALSDNEIKALCEEAKKIEEHYGTPMDIEWAIADGKVYMLQARAITTLKEKIPEDLIESYVSGCKASGVSQKDLVFILEKIQDPYLPFDYDATYALIGQREAIFEELGMNMKTQPEIDDDGVSTLPVGKTSFNKNVFKIPAALKEMGNAEYCLQKVEELMPPLKKRMEEIRSTDVKSLDLGQCAVWNSTIYKYIQDLAYTRFRYFMLPNAIVGNSVDKALRKVDRNLTHYDFLSDLEYKTAVVASDISKLAEKAKTIPGCVEAIKNRAPYGEIYENFPELQEMLDRFMEDNGYKADFTDYCVKSKSFHEDPDRILRIMTPLVCETEAGKTNEDKSYSTLLAKVQAVYSGKKYEQLKFKIEALRKFHVVRESSQYMWEEAYYHMRKILERAAYLLTGDSDVYKSVAYLRMTEFEQACKDGCLDESMREKISRRIMKRPLAEAVWDRIKTIVLIDNKRENNTSETLKGASGSAGVAVGKVCIVRDPSEFYKMEKGAVLVCPYTDPEWTPLFLLASAVVADTGGNLSHAAIVAREYGIPAVLGVGYATSHYKDGDLVKVDGNKGEVTKA